MTDWLRSTPFDRRLLDGKPLRGPTPWVVAIMSFSILLIAALGLGLANMASALNQSIESRFAVQIVGDERAATAVAKALKTQPGVSGVEMVAEKDMRRTLERWLGPAAESHDLPIPALINFDLARAGDLPAIKRTIARLSPASTVVAHRDSVGSLLRSMRLLQWVSLGLVLMLASAAAAAVVLAARAALGTHRSTIDVMHGIGATDRQITHLFQRKIALDALAGSLAGAGAGALILLMLAAGARFAGDFTGGRILGQLDLVLLAVLPVALTALATAVARSAVLGALREDL